MNIEQGIKSPRQGNTENDPRRGGCGKPTTGETTSISERPPEENYSAPAAGAAEKATQRIGTEVSRHLEKGAEKKDP